MGFLGLVSEKKMNGMLATQAKEFKAAIFSFQQRTQQVFFNSFSFPDFGKDDPKDAFVSNDQIYSVVNKIAETTALIPGYVFEVKADVKGAVRQLKAATSRQFYTTKAIIDISNLQNKALEDLSEDDFYVQKFSQPNPYQSRTEFDTLGMTYYLLFGRAVALKLKIDAGANAGRTAETYWLPPPCVRPNLSISFPRTIESYTFRINGQIVLDNIPVEDVIDIRKTNPQITNDGQEFQGLSPLQPFGLQSELMKNLDLRAAGQVKTGGVPGIIFDKSLDADDAGQEQLDAKRNAFTNFQRNNENTGSPWMTGGDLDYKQIGLKLADMDVTNLIKISFKRLCNIYKISDILFNSDTAATESNVQEQIKQMYTNACLPLAYTFRDAYNNQWLNEATDKKRFYDIDISAVTELQDNMKELAEVYNSMPGGFTLNEMRRQFKFDDRPEDYMNIPVMKQGYVAAETLELEPSLLEDPNTSTTLRV